MPTKRKVYTHPLPILLRDEQYADLKAAALAEGAAWRCDARRPRRVPAQHRHRLPA